MPSKSGLTAAMTEPVSLQELVRSSKNPKGYVRVSTDEQSPELQFNALLAIGLKQEQIYCDIESGTNDDRPGYQNIFHGVFDRNIDLVVVNRIDRLGRNHYELVNFFFLIDNAECRLASICEPFVLHWKESAWAFRATWDSIGDARYELLRLKERQRQGIDAKQDLVERGKATWKGRGPDRQPRRRK